MKTKLIIVNLILIAGKSFSQGTFENLDFEHPNVPLNPVNSQVPIGQGMPGWTVYSGTNAGSVSTLIYYNTLSLGAAALSLQGLGSGEPILQGSYSAYLQGSTAGTPQDVGIGETGQVPLGTESLIFLGARFDNLQLSFNGQLLSYAAIGSGANYTIYGANISQYAGDSGLLLFTAEAEGAGILDDIQFSVNPVPEPSTWVLLLLSAGVVKLIRLIKGSPIFYSSRPIN